MAVEKRHVRMVSSVMTPTGPQTHEANDHVPVDILDAYVADARSKWQLVEVGEVHDPGPGGDEGETHYPEHLEGGL